LHLGASLQEVKCHVFGVEERILGTRDWQLAQVDLVLERVDKVKGGVELLLDVGQEGGLVEEGAIIKEKTLIEQDHSPCVVRDFLDLGCPQL
jgi:hypothetical protein